MASAINAYWCLCPNANIYIENTLPNIPMFLNKGCKMTLGTDSLASNSVLSIWDEIMTIHQHYPAIQLEQLIKWATLNGAESLNITDKFGSFTVGKSPGVNLLSGYSPTTKWSEISIKKLY
jgi:aminodeoxyfutalosine deaminase